MTKVAGCEEEVMFVKRIEVGEDQGQDLGRESGDGGHG